MQNRYKHRQPSDVLAIARLCQAPGTYLLLAHGVRWEFLKGRHLQWACNSLAIAKCHLQGCRDCLIFQGRSNNGNLPEACLKLQDSLAEIAHLLVKNAKLHLDLSSLWLFAGQGINPLELSRLEQILYASSNTDGLYFGIVLLKALWTWRVAACNSKIQEHKCKLSSCSSSDTLGTHNG